MVRRLLPACACLTPCISHDLSSVLVIVRWESSVSYLFTVVGGICLCQVSMQCIVGL